MKVAASLMTATLAMLLCSVVWPQSPRTTDEQTVYRLNEEWLKAYDAGDVPTLDRIEDDSFTVSGEFGEVTKAHQLDGVRKRAGASLAGNRKIDHQQFRSYGDAMLVTEVDHSSSTDGSDDFQSTTVWVRHGSTWRVIHLHFSRLAR